VSALNGEGLDELRQIIAKAVAGTLADDLNAVGPASTYSTVDTDDPTGGHPSDDDAAEDARRHQQRHLHSSS
jgi:hypothetical protein